MTLLLLKLTLSPLFICGVTLAARRWGMGIGGWLASMPVNGGPILLFFALEQGEAFAAEAAAFTLVSIMGVAAFSLVYAWMARRFHWGWCLAWAWTTFFGLMYLLRAWHLPLLPMLLWAVGSLLVARYLLPAPRRDHERPAATRWDLPLRLLTAVALVLALTHLAHILGPRWSGLLTAFPIASTVVAGFTHARQGGDAVLVFYRGMLAGMPGFCLFCTVLAMTLVPMGTFVAFVLALIAQLAAHAFGLFLMRRNRSN